MITSILSKNDTTNKDQFSISELPQSIVESDIFAYLTTKDLFYSIRGVCSEWQELMKNIWTENIKSEMIDQVKSLDFIYEKEIFTKTYEFKLNYLINYKQLLSIYSTQTNILSIMNTYTNRLNETDFRKFFQIFFSFVGLEFAHDCIEKLGDESMEELKISIVNNLEEYLSKEENLSIFRNKISEFLDFDTCTRDQESIAKYKQEISLINRGEFENSEENTKLLFTFLQGIIEFQVLKSEVKELRKKIEILIQRIKEETQVWPKRKNFFEKAYKLIIFSKSTNEGGRRMIDLFESQKIRHPLVDFNDQALQMIYDLKYQLTKFYDSEFFSEENFGDSGSKSMEEIIFNNILSRRVLLTQKILIMDKYNQIYEETKTENKNLFRLNNDVDANLKQLLWCMKFSSNSENENLSIESILKTKSYLDDHFDYENNIIYDCKKTKNVECKDPDLEVDMSDLDKELEHTLKNSEISLRENKFENIAEQTEISKNNNSIKISRNYTEGDLNKLKEEKETLEKQKLKTENVLEMLKKFVALKQNLSNNKKKYKLALYLLSKIRQGDTSVISNLDEIDVESIEFDTDMPISENEREELDNFKDSDKLMKEIEEGILAQIEKILKKENEQNNLSKEN